MPKDTRVPDEAIRRTLPAMGGKSGTFNTSQEASLSADQIAAISPIVAEILDAHSEQPELDYCANFCVPGRESAWVQVVHDKVNFAYPFTEDPIERLGRLGIAMLPGLALRKWQPGLYTTVSFTRHARSREIARFVDAILGLVLDCGEDYPVDAEIERLDNGGDPGEA